MVNILKSYFLKGVIVNRLKSQNKDLQEELRTRESFPFKNGNLRIYNIWKTGERKFYDSCWVIFGAENGSDFSISLTRYDTETFKNMVEILSEASTVSEIRALDERNRIYYD